MLTDGHPAQEHWKYYRPDLEARDPERMCLESNYSLRTALPMQLTGVFSWSILMTGDSARARCVCHILERG